MLPIQLDDIVTQRLESVNGDAAASDVVFASFGVALCKLAGVDRASVGCVVDGRHLAELRGAIGPLSKVASVSVPGDMRAFGDVVGAVAAARNETTGRFESLPRQALGAVPGAAFEWRSNMPRRGQAGVVFSAAVPRSTVGGYHLKLIGTVADDTPKLELLYDGGQIAADPLQYADFAEWQAQLLESDQTRDLPAPTDDPQIPFTSAASRRRLSARRSGSRCETG